MLDASGLSALSIDDERKSYGQITTPAHRDCERRFGENRSRILPATPGADRLCATPVLGGSDWEVNAPEKTHIEIVRHVAAVCPPPRSWIDMRAVI